MTDLTQLVGVAAAFAIEVGAVAPLTTKRALAEAHESARHKVGAGIRARLHPRDLHAGVHAIFPVLVGRLHDILHRRDRLPHPLDRDTPHLARLYRLLPADRADLQGAGRRSSLPPPLSLRAPAGSLLDLHRGCGRLCRRERALHIHRPDRQRRDCELCPIVQREPEALGALAVCDFSSLSHRPSLLWRFGLSQTRRQSAR